MRPSRPSEVELLFCDAGFACEVLAHPAARAGKKKLAGKLGRFTESAKGPGERLLTHLPGES